LVWKIYALKILDNQENQLLSILQSNKYWYIFPKKATFSRIILLSKALTLPFVLGMHYDLIIAGMGAAGLDLAYRLQQHPRLRQWRLLLLEKQPKNQNDRTWSFWTKQPTPYDDIVYHRWDKLWFHNERFSKMLDPKPYSYQTIRGIDFYRHTLNFLEQCPNVDIVYGQVTAIRSEGQTAVVNLQQEENHSTYTAPWAFSALYTPPKPNGKHHFFHQHFKGWVLETDKPVFDASKATFMDFRIPQHRQTRFVYLLPTSPTRCLVEFTIFSEPLLAKDEYDIHLKEYLQQYWPQLQYRIVEEEFGIIPMFDIPHPYQQSARVFNLGTAAGNNKPSTGYAFMNILKHNTQILKSLDKSGSPDFRHGGAWRFKLYDSILLNVMKHDRVPAPEIFGRMMERHPVTRVFRFLDEESHFGEELQIMASMPMLPFLRSVPKALRLHTIG
jgi:lycopene beta-cyclase